MVAAKKHHELVYRTVVGLIGGMGPEATLDIFSQVLRSQHRRSSNAGGGYEWQLLLFFHGQQLRLAATKQRLRLLEARWSLSGLFALRPPCEEL